MFGNYITDGTKHTLKSVLFLCSQNYLSIKKRLIMSTNHQMNYYDYGKTLDIQGIMPVIGGEGKP